MTMTDSQRIFFQTGQTLPAIWRKKQLRGLLKAIKTHERELYSAFESDLRKSRFETMLTETGLIKKNIRDTIKSLDGWIKPVKKKTPFFLFGRSSYTVYEPYGTVLIIGPFNYPFLSVFEPLIGAIASGNTAVVKPSELTPNISNVIREIIDTAFSDEYVSVVIGGAETTMELLEQHFDFIFFTGSPRVGKIVMESASKHLTPVLLELGGKSPAIVCETSDIKWAAKRIIWGKLLNAGQVCIAPDYCLVPDKLKQSLIEAMITEIKMLYGKDAANSKDYGRIVTLSHADRLHSIIQEHKNDIAYGGERSGTFVEPTILDITSIDSKAMEEEIFGPILPVIGYESINEMYDIISKNPKPLACYVFSGKRKKAEEIISNIPSGGAMINDVILQVVNQHLPFGGVGSSGMGQFHGKYSIEAFSNQKSVMRTWFFGGDRLTTAPYSKKKHLIFKWFLR